MTFPQHAAQSLHTTITLTQPTAQMPDGTARGPFTPLSFAEWIGHQIDVPGLDVAHPHVLVGVDVTDDGATARLAVRTDLGPIGDLTAHLNVSTLTPEAAVRLVDHDTGDILLETTHSAPLADGSWHRVNGTPVQVVSHHWPERHPEHGCVQPHPDTGEYPTDVQEIRVRVTPEPAVTPVAVAS